MILCLLLFVEIKRKFSLLLLYLTCFLETFLNRGEDLFFVLMGTSEIPDDVLDAETDFKLHLDLNLDLEIMEGDIWYLVSFEQIIGGHNSNFERSLLLGRIF